MITLPDHHLEDCAEETMSITIKHAVWLCATLCALVLAALTPRSALAAQTTFASPAAGIAALVQAVKADDESALRAMFGPRTGKLVQSGDAVADQQNRASFLRAYDEANSIVPDGDARAHLTIGRDAWPLPIPLVKARDGNWQFDARSGEDEIIARRIGRNELAAIQVALAIVDAQREFARRDSGRDGLSEYAARFASLPGKRDGLYWPVNPGETLSPLGPLLAAAAKEGYVSTDTGSLVPYHGYYYKILTRQGKNAPGGAHSYFVNGQMVGGFALIAYPARHGASGIMSFIVSQDGVVHEKNLGRNTHAIAAGMTSFNPDASWKRPQPAPN